MFGSRVILIMVDTGSPLPGRMELTEIAVQNGLGKKRANAIAAVLCGALPAIVLGFWFLPGGWEKVWFFGITVGLIWGNGFEYVYHRWLLHQPRTLLGVGHREHHARTGTPDEAEHVALISSPLNVVLLFVINAVPAFLIATLVGFREVLSGIFVGWAAYLIITEEIHWRIHMKEWLPVGLRSARAYHMSHHALPNGRYNVFFPLFDLLFGSAKRIWS